MTYEIYQDGQHINTIVADKSFVEQYCKNNNYSYKEGPMTIIKILPNENGSHSNQTTSSPITPPEGWAVFPDTLDKTNFPFGEVEAELVDGVMTVTSWTPGELPEPGPEPEPELTQLDRVEAQATYTAMMTDTLLEV